MEVGGFSGNCCLLSLWSLCGYLVVMWLGRWRVWSAGVVGVASVLTGGSWFELDLSVVLFSGTVLLFLGVVAAVVYFYVLDPDPYGFLDADGGEWRGWIEAWKRHVNSAKAELAEAEEVHQRKDSSSAQESKQGVAEEKGERVKGKEEEKERGGGGVGKRWKVTVEEWKERLAAATWASKHWQLLYRATVEFGSWRALVPMCCSAALIVLSGNADAVFMSEIVDVATAGLLGRDATTAAVTKGTTTLRFLFVGYTLVRMINHMAWVAKGLMEEQSRWTIGGTICRRLYSTIMAQDLAYHENRRPGELKSLIQDDSTKITDAMIQFYFTGVRMLLRIVLCGWITLRTDPVLLFGMIGAKLTFTLLIRPERRIHRSRCIQELYDDRKMDLTGMVTETLHSKAARLIQACSAMEGEIARHRDGFKRGISSRRHLELVVQYGYNLSGLFSTCLDVAFFFCAMGRLQTGRMTGGDYILFGESIMTLVGSFDYLSNLQSKLMNSTLAAERVFQLLDRTPTIANVTKTSYDAPCSGSIRFRNVHFAYPADQSTATSPVDDATAVEAETEKDSSGGKTEVLHGIDLVVDPGEVIALCGPSGAGKSTIVSLMMRLYDVADGTIEIDGRDVRTVELGWLRNQFGFIEQEPTVFDRSIEDNIRIGGGVQTTRADVEAAAKLANAHEFIVQLPNGYDTVLGQDGVKLSGGQRQRIAIARACVGNRPILIMDEATSSLDAQNEATVQRSIDRAAANRTTIIVAHRLNTIQRAKRILVVENGRIVEAGTHDELIAKGSDGSYYKLVTQQMNA